MLPTSGVSSRRAICASVAGIALVSLMLYLLSIVAARSATAVCKSCQTEAERAREALAQIVLARNAPLAAWVGLRESLRPWGVAVEWTPDSRRAFTGGRRPRVEVWVGRNQARIGAREFPLQAPARLVDGRVEIPLSFLVEIQAAFIAAGQGQPYLPSPVPERESDPRCQKCHSGVAEVHRNLAAPESPRRGKWVSPAVRLMELQRPASPPHPEEKE